MVQRTAWKLFGAFKDTPNALPWDLNHMSRMSIQEPRYRKIKPGVQTITTGTWTLWKRKWNWLFRVRKEAAVQHSWVYKVKMLLTAVCFNSSLQRPEFLVYVTTILQKHYDLFCQGCSTLLRNTVTHLTVCAPRRLLLSFCRTSFTKVHI